MASKVALSNKVTFVVGKGENRESFQCLRSVIAQESQILKAMVFEQEADKSVIYLPDDDPGTFHSIIKFSLHQKVVLCGIEEAIDVYNLMDKYLMSNGKRKCFSFLAKKVTKTSCCILLEFATKKNEHSLAYNCWKYIKSNAEDVLTSISEGTFCCKIEIDTLIEIIRQDQLDIKSEVTVYKACVEWAKLECARTDQEPTPEALRRLMEPLIPHVRFLTLSREDMAEKVFEDGILTPLEQFEVLKALNVNTCSLVMSPTFNYTKKFRKAPGDCYFYTDCKRSVRDVSIKSDEIISTRFFTDASGIFVRGVTLDIDNFDESIAAVFSIRNVARGIDVTERVWKDWKTEPPHKIEIKSCVFVQKREVCEITLSNVNAHGYVCCSSKCQLDSRLIRDSTFNSTNNYHFRAIIGLIID